MGGPHMIGEEADPRHHAIHMGLGEAGRCLRRRLQAKMPGTTLVVSVCLLPYPGHEPITHCVRLHMGSRLWLVPKKLVPGAAGKQSL